MLPGPSDGDNFLTEDFTSQMTGACAKLTENQPAQKPSAGNQLHLKLTGGLRDRQKARL